MIIGIGLGLSVCILRLERSHYWRGYERVVACTVVLSQSRLRTHVFFNYHKPSEVNEYTKKKGEKGEGEEFPFRALRVRYRTSVLIKKPGTHARVVTTLFMERVSEQKTSNRFSHCSRS